MDESTGTLAPLSMSLQRNWCNFSTSFRQSILIQTAAGQLDKLIDTFSPNMSSLMALCIASERLTPGSTSHQLIHQYSHQWLWLFAYSEMIFQHLSTYTIFITGITGFQKMKRTGCDFRIVHAATSNDSSIISEVTLA